MYLYILKQTQNKFYVGKTRYLKSRIINHFMFKKKGWTNKYKPESVYFIKKMNLAFEEDMKTLEMMKKYGIDNVRGGSFSNIQLSNCEISIINKMINTAEDKCFICGSNTHFESDCPHKNIMF